MTPASGDREAEGPKVSVLLQTYNHERFVAEAIESVLAQDASFPIELIVSDDLSTDSTREIVSGFARERPQVIKPNFPDEHLGMNPLFRRALEAASGEFIALLDGDDYWTATDKLARQVALLDAEPEVTGCFHDARVVDADASRPERRYLPADARKARFGVEDLLPLCYPPTLSVLIRRAALADVPEWAFDYAWTDWLIWIFAARRGPFAYIDEPMGVYRVHPGGYFSSQDRATQLEEDLRVYARLGEELPEHRTLIERCVAARGCELAVEDCGVPFDAPLVVVGNFAGLPLLFNGREVRRLDTGGKSTRDAIEELELLCAKPAARPTPEWRSRVAIRESGGESCCYAVVASSPDAAPGADAIAARLARVGSMIWDDGRSAIYEIPQGPISMGPVVVAEVTRPLPGGDGSRGRIEAPAVGASVDPAAVRIGGWVLGREGPVAAVEVALDGAVLWSGTAGVERPDVARAFPDRAWARAAGFVATVAVPEARAGDAFDLEVSATLADQTRIEVGRVRLRRQFVASPPSNRQALVAPERSEWRHLQALDAQGAVVERVNADADRFVREAVVQLRREVAAAGNARRAEAEFQRLRRQSGLKVNLGCGPDVREGWVNIDLTVGNRSGGEEATGTTVIEFDLRRGLPLADASCAVLYSSHFLEHLEYRQALALMRDCHRCLEEGGLLRLALPDFRLDFEAYLSGDWTYIEEFERIASPVLGESFELIQGMPGELRGKAIADYLNFFVYQYGEHKTIFDHENARLMLEHVGFYSVQRSSHREDLDGADEIRRRYSFYIEAVK